MKFDRHIGSTAAEVPVKFQSDQTILNTNLAASRLYEILRKDIFSGIETGPCYFVLIQVLIKFINRPLMNNGDLMNIASRGKHYFQAYRLEKFPDAQLTVG